MITLNFSVEQVNTLLQMLGNLPFAQVNGMIQEIVTQGQPQADALDAAAKAAAEEAVATPE
jgi:hypothetical protein